MPARHSNLGGIQKIVAGGARPGLFFRRDLFFSGGNPAKTPGRQSPDFGCMKYRDRTFSKTNPIKDMFNR